MVFDNFNSLLLIAAFTFVVYCKIFNGEKIAHLP